MIGQGWEIGYENQRIITGEGYRITDNTEAVLDQLSRNMARAAAAVGIEAVGMVRQMMETGYHDVHPVTSKAKKSKSLALAVKRIFYRVKTGLRRFVGKDTIKHEKPEAGKEPGKETNGKYPHTNIRDTSALINDVQYDVREIENGVEVHVGNTLEYALFVHDGTRYLKKRPYIKDAIQKGWARLQAIWAAYLKEEFDETPNKYHPAWHGEEPHGQKKRKRLTQ